MKRCGNKPLHKKTCYRFCYNAVKKIIFFFFYRDSLVNSGIPFFLASFSVTILVHVTIFSCFGNKI